MSWFTKFTVSAGIGLFLVSNVMAQDNRQDAIPIARNSVNQSRYYQHLSRMGSYLRTNRLVQRAIDLSPQELSEVQEVMQYHRAGSRGVRLSIAQRIDRWESGLKDVLGKSRFRRLNQITYQIQVPDRAQLYSRIYSDRYFADNISTDKEYEHIRSAYNTYRQEMTKLSTSYRNKEIDRTEYYTRRNRIQQDYNNNRSEYVSDELWERFQAFVGEPFQS